jgi:transposase
MLLRSDLRDWGPEDDLVPFVIEAGERLRLESVRINPRGTGDKECPPHMMLALLICSYPNGLFSSRKIERATDREMAIRYLCAGTHRGGQGLGWKAQSHRRTGLWDHQGSAGLSRVRAAR